MDDPKTYRFQVTRLEASVLDTILRRALDGQAPMSAQEIEVATAIGLECRTIVRRANG